MKRALGATRSRWLTIMVLLLAGVLLSASCSNSPGSPAPAGSGGVPSGGATGSTDRGRPTYELGQVREGSVQGGAKLGCGQGGVECTALQVACPHVQMPGRAVLLMQHARSAPKGMVLFFSGGGGGHAWDEKTAGAASFLTGLTQQGLDVIQVVWLPQSWLQSAPGEEVGPALLACRPATVINWVHDNRYQQPKANAAGPLKCGFCLTGNSGGSSQVAYALTDYGLANIVDAAVETGGPVHSQIAKGCLGDPLYAYDQLAFTIDISYGQRSGSCTRRDGSFTDRWNRDSVDAPGGDFDYPKTLVVFIVTNPDEPGRTDVHHALAYYDKLKAAGSPHLKLTEIAGLPHEIETSQAGLDAMGALFVAR